MRKAVYDFIARNRRWIGGLALALWTGAQGDAALLATHPRLMSYAGVVAAYIFASGMHKPDSMVKLTQAVEKQGE